MRGYLILGSLKSFRKLPYLSSLDGCAFRQFITTVGTCSKLSLGSDNLFKLTRTRGSLQAGS